MEIANRTLDPQSALALGQSRALPRLPTTAQGIEKLTKTANGTQDLNKLRKTAQDFEGVFLAQMFKPMFDGLEAKPPFGGGPAENMWKSLMIDEFGKSIAKSGGIGISGDVMKEMLKLQEAKSHATKTADVKPQEAPHG